MSFISKLKQLLKSSNIEQATPAPPPEPASTVTLTEQITHWVELQSWKYETRQSDNNPNLNYVILGFSDAEHDWTCVFCIQEKIGLVSIFAILDRIVPVSHYTAVLMAFAKANRNIYYGNLELDPNDGEVRAKLSFDGEFTTLGDKALSCYVQAVAGLSALAHQLVSAAMTLDAPSQYAGDYIEGRDELVADVDGDEQVFFIPTKTSQ